MVAKNGSVLKRGVVVRTNTAQSRLNEGVGLDQFWDAFLQIQQLLRGQQIVDRRPAEALRVGKIELSLDDFEQTGRINAIDAFEPSTEGRGLV